MVLGTTVSSCSNSRDEDTLSSTLYFHRHYVTVKVEAYLPVNRNRCSILSARFAWCCNGWLWLYHCNVYATHIDLCQLFVFNLPTMLYRRRHIGQQGLDHKCRSRMWRTWTLCNCYAPISVTKWHFYIHTLEKLMMVLTRSLCLRMGLQLTFDAAAELSFRPHLLTLLSLS